MILLVWISLPIIRHMVISSSGSYVQTCYCPGLGFKRPQFLFLLGILYDCDYWDIGYMYAWLYKPLPSSFPSGYITVAFHQIHMLHACQYLVLSSLLAFLIAVYKLLAYYRNRYNPYPYLDEASSKDSGKCLLWKTLCMVFKICAKMNLSYFSDATDRDRQKEVTCPRSMPKCP